MNFRHLALPLLAAGAVLAAAPPMAAQEISINLNPDMMTSSKCGLLFAGFSTQPKDVAEATKQAAEGGYRLGYVMGYVHGVLDKGGPQRKLNQQEFETFVGAYKLICDANADTTIYDAANEAMQYQSR